MSFLTKLNSINPVNLAKKWWKLKGFKKWFLLIIFLFLVFFIFNRASAAINKGKPDLRRYQITQVELGDMQKIISKEGILRYAGVVDFPSPSSGVVDEIFVENNQLLKEGQKIISITSTATKEEQLEALNQYLSAKNSLEAAKTAKITSQTTLETARQTVLETSQTRQNMDDRFSVGDRQNPTANRPDKNYTDNEIEAIRSAETQARNKFTAAERDFNNADLKIQSAQAAYNSSLWKYQLTMNSVITAPVAGRLVNLNLFPGETVSSKNESLFKIISSDDFLITLKVSEAEIIYFKVDQTSEFKVSIYPDDKFTGKVVSVDELGTQIESDNGLLMEYTVKIKPDSIDKKLLSPLTVDTETIVEEKSSVLKVPNSAVTYGSGKRTVTVVKDGRTEVREVTLGIIGDNDTEIISGLSQGESVLIPKTNAI